MDFGEWTDASHATIAIGWTFSGDVWIMNDAENLYVAVKIADSSLADPDQIWIVFDNNNDGTGGTGEEILVWSFAEGFVDAFWTGTELRKDILFGGNNDGAGSASNAGGFNYFELKHPLNSGTAQDFSLSGGSTVGFVVGYLTTMPVTGTYVGFWPECPPTPLAKNWAHYTVAVIAPSLTIAFNPPVVDIGTSPPGTATITATITPNVAGKAVVLSYRKDPATSWTPIGSGTTDAAGQVPITWTPPETGTYYFRAEITEPPLTATSDPASLIAIPEFPLWLAPMLLILSLATVTVLLRKVCRRQDSL